MKLYRVGLLIRFNEEHGFFFPLWGSESCKITSTRRKLNCSIPLRVPRLSRECLSNPVSFTTQDTGRSLGGAWNTELLLIQKMGDSASYFLKRWKEGSLAHQVYASSQRSPIQPLTIPASNMLINSPTFQIPPLTYTKWNGTEKYRNAKSK